MHPNRAFRFENDQAALDWALARGFAHILAATAKGPIVAHAPIVPAGNGAVRFHLSRANRIVPLLEGASVVLSVAGEDGYITPNWYAAPTQQVPTWNYVAVEIDGSCRMLAEDALVAQLDTLAATHEPLVSPGNPWTRAKMDKDRFRKLLGAIIGFEVTVEAVRSTCKLSQNKTAEDIAGVIDGLSRTGNAPLADLMRAGR